MTNKRRLAVLLLALLISTFLTLGCMDDWDGMDRSDWRPTPTAIF